MGDGAVGRGDEVTITHAAGTVDTDRFLALCTDCGGGRWVTSARAADLWLQHHPHQEGGAA